MTKEQIIELRKLHEGYNMSVFRTEGVTHHENTDKAHLIWDDALGVCHSINTNVNAHYMKGKTITTDSFDYEAITGIYSNRNVEELKVFLDQLKAKGLITEKEYNDIVKDYDPLIDRSNKK